MNITVYLGANKGNNAKFHEQIVLLGRTIAKRGDTVVYGGSKVGLMGMLADAALSENGYVIGIEPQMFIDGEKQHTGLNELIVTDNMGDRKELMMDKGDSFIAFPGGLGTLDEISEVAELMSLKLLFGPCMFFNIDGYYDDIRSFIKKAIASGFILEKQIGHLYFPETIEEVYEIIDRYREKKR